MGETFFSGIVAPSVARFVAIDGAGRETEVQVTSPAFAFQGQEIAIVEVVDPDGRFLDR